MKCTHVRRRRWPSTLLPTTTTTTATLGSARPAKMQFKRETRAHIQPTVYRALSLYITHMFVCASVCSHAARVSNELISICYSTSFLFVARLPALRRSCVYRLGPRGCAAAAPRSPRTHRMERTNMLLSKPTSVHISKHTQTHTGAANERWRRRTGI